MNSVAAEKTIPVAPPRAWPAATIAAFKRVLVPFLLSRLVILFIFGVTPAMTAVSVSQWNSDDGTAIRLSKASLAQGVSAVAIGNDSAWYYTIAHDGYEKRPFDTSHQANWAFFPLHPLLWRAVAAITGEWIGSGVLLANVLMLIGLCALWRLAYDLTGKRETADASVVFACLWPASYFMSLPHTEALFFTLACLSLLAARRGAFPAAGIAGALASATRFNGLFLIPSLLAAWVVSDRRKRHLLWIAVGVAGTALYAAYLWSITGNALAFKDIQVAWGRGLAAPWAAIADYIGHPTKIAVSWNPRLINFLSVVAGIASVVACWKRGWRDIAIFTALTMLAPLCTGTLTSMTRYLGVAPGLFIAFAAWSERSPRVGQGLLALSSVVLTLMCVLFAAGIDIAGA